MLELVGEGTARIRMFASVLQTARCTKSDNSLLQPVPHNFFYW